MRRRVFSTHSPIDIYAVRLLKVGAKFVLMRDVFSNERAQFFG